jgi:hypothetical protein
MNKALESAEDAILRYQYAIKEHDDLLAEKCYNEILKHYNPFDYRNVWWRKYGWLYNFDEEEFDTDYKIKFIQCICKFSPKNNKQNINNYFFKACENMYGTIINRRNTNKRNIKQKCPICLKYAQNISSHIKDNHYELAWDNVLSIGMSEKNFKDGCPFCPNYLPIKKIQSENIDEIKKHLSKFHPGMIFEKFKELFPNFYIGNDHLSLFSELDSDNEGFYDIINEKNSIRDSENSIGLSYFINLEKDEIENIIIEYIFDVKVSTLNSGINYRKLNNWLKNKRDSCKYSNTTVSKKQYEEAINSLQNKITMSGLDDEF